MGFLAYFLAYNEAASLSYFLNLNFVAFALILFKFFSWLSFSVFIFSNSFFLFETSVASSVKICFCMFLRLLLLLITFLLVLVCCFSNNSLKSLSKSSCWIFHSLLIQINVKLCSIDSSEITSDESLNVIFSSNTTSTFALSPSTSILFNSTV